MCYYGSLRRFLWGGNKYRNNGDIRFFHLHLDSESSIEKKRDLDRRKIGKIVIQNRKSRSRSPTLKGV